MRRILGGLLAAGWLWAPAGGVAATNWLRIGVPWTPASKGMADLRTSARTLAKRTDGRVQMKFVEQNGLESEAGACDGAMLAGTELARYSPAALVYSLPRLFRSAAEVDRGRPLLDPAIAADLEAHGLSAITGLDLGFAHLLSGSPIETVDQLKAARLWMPPVGAEAARWAESLGLSTARMDASQVRDALRAGTVDAAIVPPLGAILLQWHVEFKCVSDEPLMALAAVVAIRKEALERLDAADAAALREVLADAFAAAAADLRGKAPESMDVLVQNGVARHPLGAPPDGRAAWDAWAAEVGDRLAAEGIVPAAKLEDVRRALAEFRVEP